MTSSAIKKVALAACAALTVASLAACSAGSSASSAASSAFSSASASAQSASTSSASSSAAASAASATPVTAATFGQVPNTLAEDEAALVSEYASKFTQETYTDESTGLSVTYNLYLPEGYDVSQSYPMVVFIADSSCAKGNAEQSLTQGRGALVWASEEWQKGYPCIVCVPTYPETILDDHGSYTTTEYVELTKRLIDSVAGSYAVDTKRIYGTGQSMGCMTTLILASEYPDLYAACMFVDGQWDVTTLSGLEGQKFVYFAAEDDTSAFTGMSEVEAMFAADSIPYASAQWDGSWSCDELSTAAEELLSSGNAANFISWKTGTIVAGSNGGSASAASPNGSGMSASRGSAGANSGGGAGGGGASYHMASFDYAYNCIAVMEWLFQQSN